MEQGFLEQGARTGRTKTEDNKRKSLLLVPKILTPKN
jgi:hypothetical protein